MLLVLLLAAHGATFCAPPQQQHRLARSAARPRTSAASPTLVASSSPDAVTLEHDEPSLPPALEDALGSERAAEVWARRPPGALPNADRQAKLIDWLQMSPLAVDPERFLYPCLRREPKLLLKASSLPQLRESHAALCTLLREKESPMRFANAIAHDPALLLQPADELLATARALSAATTISERQLARVLRAEPGWLLLSTEAVERRLAWLEENLGIAPGGRLQRVLSRAPLLLLVSTSTLQGRLECLRELGVAEASLGVLAVRTPRLLHAPVASTRARVQWLRDASIVAPADAPPSAVGAFLARQPDYFSLTQGKCDAIMEWLLGLGLSPAAAGGVVAAEPSILSQSLEELQLRASFFLDVLGGAPADLSDVPQMLTCDLAKTPMLRHAFCVANGVAAAPKELLIKGDANFCEQVGGCTLDELNAFEADGLHLSFFQGAEM